MNFMLDSLFSTDRFELISRVLVLGLYWTNSDTYHANFNNDETIKVISKETIDTVLHFYLQLFLLFLRSIYCSVNPIKSNIFSYCDI